MKLWGTFDALNPLHISAIMISFLSSFDLRYTAQEVYMCLAIHSGLWMVPMTLR